MVEEHRGISGVFKYSIDDRGILRIHSQEDWEMSVENAMLSLVEIIGKVAIRVSQIKHASDEAREGRSSN